MVLYELGTASTPIDETWTVREIWRHLHSSTNQKTSAMLTWSYGPAGLEYS